MPDQSLISSQRARYIVPQGPSAERADKSLRQLENVSMLVIAAMDDMYGMAEEYCQQGTRSAGHQKRLLERTAHVLDHFDEGAMRVRRDAFDGILNRRWDEQPVTRIIEVPVPQKGLFPGCLGNNRTVGAGRK